MNDFLLVLFYQAIVAVNTAVILSGIIWLAKRKEKKDGRKPNPDFTPPPEKKPEVELRSALIKTVNGEKIAQRWYSPDEQIPQYAILQGEPYKFFAEIDKDGGKLVEFARIKPPTTGTNVIEPKPHGYHLTMTTYDAKDYGKTHTFNGEEYERTMVGQSADGSVVSMIYIRKHPQPKPYPHDIEALKASLDEWKREPPMHIPTEGAKEHKCDKFSCFCAPFSNLTREQVLDGLDRYIKDFHRDDLLDRVENEIRKRIKDDQRTGTQPIQSFIGEVRGGPGNEVMGTVTAKSAEEMEEKLEAFNQCETCRWSDDMGYCHNEKLCNPEKKPYFAARKVNPNQPFCWYWEQAFRTDSNGNKTPARISIAKPKERNAFGVDTETAAKIAKAAAGNAGASATDEIAEKLNEIAKAGYTKQITPDEAKKPPCKECRCFDGETGDNFGLCFNREEIVGTYDRRLCFKPKGASKAKPNPATRPAPLGTVTIGGRNRER